MKNKTAGRGYVRKNCYSCYHCYCKANKSKSCAECSDPVTEVTEIFTLPYMVSICRQTVRRNRCKNLPYGQNLVTHFVRNNRNIHHTRGLVRWN